MSTLPLSEDNLVGECFAVCVTNDMQYRVACPADIVLTDRVRQDNETGVVATLVNPLVCQFWQRVRIA